MKRETPILTFSTPELFRSWLTIHHTNEEGIWLRLYKKDSGVATITHAEALDEALCFGWIDGLGKSYDNLSWILKFTPRREKSVWSKRNRENVSRLTKENKMMPSGMKAVEDAKKDGRWDAAYDSPKNMQIPEDFLAELKKDNKAYTFFKTLNKSNVYAIAWRLQTAKRENTRKSRMEKLLLMMKTEKKLY